MFKVRRVVSEFGVDGWVLVSTALVAILIGLLDFTPLVNITTDPTLRMILIALGMTMAAIVAQTGRRTAEMKELRDTLGAASIELISSGSDFQNHTKQRIAKATKFVLDTTLNIEEAIIVHPADNPNHYYHTIYERVYKKEITYRRVEVIFNQERLEQVIARLLIHEGQEYFIRYYNPPPKPIPVLNLMSIDNDGFYLGGFYSSDAPNDIVGFVFIRDVQIGRFLEAYWNNLWFSAKPLNERKRINWEELKLIAQRLGMTDEEFASIVSKWRDEVQRRKRRTR